MIAIKKSSITILAFVMLGAWPCSGFAPTPTKKTTTTSLISTTTTSLDAAYVPDGLSVEEYRQIKQQDKKKLGKNLGRLGPRGFTSRSLRAWQEAYESGQEDHKMAPPIGYRQQLQAKMMRLEDVPYMMRDGGSWDNSDLVKQGDIAAAARRKTWLKADKEYANGGYKKEQSVSILGSGPGLNWTGEKRDKAKNMKWTFPGFS